MISVVQLFILRHYRIAILDSSDDGRLPWQTMHVTSFMHLCLDIAFICKIRTGVIFGFYSGFFDLSFQFWILDGVSIN